MCGACGLNLFYMGSSGALLTSAFISTFWNDANNPIRTRGAGRFLHQTIMDQNVDEKTKRLTGILILNWSSPPNTCKQPFYYPPKSILKTHKTLKIKILLLTILALPSISPFFDFQSYFVCCGLADVCFMSPVPIGDACTGLEAEMTADG